MMPNGFKNSLILTIFTSDDLPINIVATADADDFYKDAFGTDILAVPSGWLVLLKLSFKCWIW